MIDTDTYKILQAKIAESDGGILPVVHIEDQEAWRWIVQNTIERATSESDLPENTRFFPAKSLQDLEKILSILEDTIFLAPIIIVDLNLNTEGAPDRDGLVWLMINLHQLHSRNCELFLLSTNLQRDPELVRSLKVYIDEKRFLDKDHTNYETLRSILQSSARRIIEGIVHKSIPFPHQDRISIEEHHAKAVCEFRVYMNKFQDLVEPYEIRRGNWYDVTIAITALPKISGSDVGRSTSLIAVPYSPDAEIMYRDRIYNDLEKQVEIPVQIPDYGDVPKFERFQIRFSRELDRKETELLVYLYNRNYLMYRFHFAIVLT